MMLVREPQTTDSLSDTAEERILVLAPVGRDGALMVRALEEVGIRACLCDSLARLGAELEAGAAAVLLTVEALNERSLERLAATLKRQPPWSDLPLLLLVNAVERAGVESMLTLLGNVTVLEKPLRLSSLLSAVRTALRARRRQYQVRALLAQTEQARLEAERQQAQIEALNERLQRAMTETHHRVKNNLQIISSMIEMQVLDSVQMVPIREMQRLSAHVRVLAAVHDLLTEQAKEDGQAHYISSAEILEKLLPLMQQTAGERHIDFTAAEAQLTARQGTALALIVNELVNNALKHGHGTVLVRFTRREDEAKLAVCDGGPGFPADFDPLKAAHTGLELVERLSRWDLQGRTNYENRPEGGACITICIPLTTSASSR